MLGPGSVDDVSGLEPCSEEDTPLAPYVTEEENDDSDDSDDVRELPPWAANESLEAFVEDDLMPALKISHGTASATSNPH